MNEMKLLQWQLFNMLFMQ